MPSLLLRVLLGLDRMAAAVQVAVRALIEEVALAWIPAVQRPAITESIYTGQRTYLPGGGHFERALFGWEEEALARFFPQEGHILVGAAGGGREMAALAERGYRVSGFEPVGALAGAARTVLSAHRGAQIARGSYQDFVAAVHETRGGPVRHLLVGAPFDGVILGWGSLSHLLHPDEREALMRALRQVAPVAPVLISYMLPAAAAGRGRRTLRRLIGPGSAADPGPIGFLPWAGFYVGLPDAEIDRLAASAGYEVRFRRHQPHPHAVLIPSGPLPAEHAAS